MVLVAAALVAWALPSSVAFFARAPVEFWAIASLALGIDLPLSAASRRIGVPRTTLSVCFTFAIFLLWGAAPAIVVQALAAAVAAVGQRHNPARAIFLVGRLVCALAAAEFAVELTESRPLTSPGEGLTGDDIASFLVPVVVWFGVSFGLLVLARATAFGGGFRRAAVELREEVLATAAAILLVSPLLTTTSGWSSVLVAVPLFAWNQLSREYARREQRLRSDPVTGLLNRRGLVIAVEELTVDDALNPEQPRPFGVVLLNVESVFAVNRTLGREVYEEIVRVAARRLVNEFGADRVGRLSGEGFVVIVPGLTEDDAIPEVMRGAAVLLPFIDVDAIPFSLDPAAGVALSPQHGRDFDTLVAHADLAMSEARQRGVPAALYAREAREVTQRRIEIISELRSTLRDPYRHGDIVVVYQPQVQVATGRLAGAEALVRWTHPRWGPVPPDELFEAVEPTQVMHLLTRYVLNRVCGQLREWHGRGLPIRVAVNASVQDLRDPDFPAQISELLHSFHVPPEHLTIELTERMLIDDTERVARVATKIAALGVGLSLDDFGTGFASLQQLRALPLTEVKIDRSYVRDVADSQAQLAIVQGVHQLARAMRLHVVAEGVEDERTAEVLSRMPGTIGQGWYFGHPLPAHEFEEQWRRLMLSPRS